jgi:hypothetical protein
MAVPPDWTCLLSALKLISRGGYNDISPFHCETDVLTVMADPEMFTSTELDQLAEWGFDAGPDAGTFTSRRFGSA